MADVSSSPCVELGTGRYRVERCEPASCRTPIFVRCRERVAAWMNQGSTMNEGSTCKRCHRSLPPEAFGHLQSGRVTVTCEGCREKRWRRKAR